MQQPLKGPPTRGWRIFLSYPPDKQEKATLAVLEQAEASCRDWAAQVKRR